MNKQLGTKWFTFYTKVRPWLACLGTIPVVVDFLQYAHVYTRFWWMMLYFVTAITQAVLAVMVFVKSQGDYVDFVRFVKGVLIFETITIAYGQGVQQYIQNDFDFAIAFIVTAVILLLDYFIWYRLNIKYFKKRIGVITSDYLEDDPNRLTECKTCGYRSAEYFDACPNCGKYSKRYVYLNETNNHTAQVRYCRKCGEKLLDDSKFCSRCGTKIIEEQ